MTIAEDIAALEKALEAGPTSAWLTHPRDDNKWKENNRFAQECTPDRIKRVLDAVKERNLDALQASGEALQNWNAFKEAETKLSKAVELLKEAHIPSALHSDLDARIGEFLRENGK